jgi:adenosylhomocysteine nucleosidase
VPPRTIAVLFAVRQELNPLAGRLSRASQPVPALAGLPVAAGHAGDTTVLLCAGGIGHRRATEAAELIARHWQPDLLVIAGVAGALDPRLKVGDILIADQVFHQATGALLECPAAPDAPPGGAHGLLFSAAEVLVTASAK